MPFDATKPANNAALSSTEMRGQLTSLKSEIDLKAATTVLNTAIADTARNVNAVGVPPIYDEVQQILDKLNELIGGLHR